jgi:hypothetical protein
LNYWWKKFFPTMMCAWQKQVEPMEQTDDCGCEDTCVPIHCVLECWSSRPFISSNKYASILECTFLVCYLFIVSSRSIANKAASHVWWFFRYWIRVFKK